MFYSFPLRILCELLLAENSEHPSDRLLGLSDLHRIIQLVGRMLKPQVEEILKIAAGL